MLPKVEALAAGTISRKDKKALRDAERQKKGRKRKHADVADPEPEPFPQQDDDADGSSQLEAKAAPISEVPAPKSKKRRATEDPTALPLLDESAAAAELVKKRKKSKSSSTTAATTTTTTSEGEGAAIDTKPPTKSRFIVFVGNLPYTTTESSLQKHFAKLQPFTLRHRTDPRTHKSKGFAFLEFENYDRMKTCLKLYHHSMFDPEALDRGEAATLVTQETAPLVDQNAAFAQHSGKHGSRQGQRKTKEKTKETARRINVELTAGGGGSKAEGRKEKIKGKNVRLEEQRKRRAELERKEKQKKDVKKERKLQGAKEGRKGKVEGVVEANGGAAVDEASLQGIHPSRLANMSR